MVVGKLHMSSPCLLSWIIFLCKGTYKPGSLVFREKVAQILIYRGMAMSSATAPDAARKHPADQIKKISNCSASHGMENDQSPEEDRDLEIALHYSKLSF